MVAKTVRKRSTRKAVKQSHQAANGWLGAVKEMSGDAGKSAARGLEHLRDNADEYVNQGLEHALRAERSAVAYIRRNPMKALAIAAGATMLCSFLFMRRNSDD